MKTVWSVCTLLLVALSGCIAEDEPETGDEGLPEVPAPPPVPPADLDISELMVASADPGNNAGMGICATPTAKCISHAFTIENGTWTVDASLEWMVPAQDFDLYLYSGGTEVAHSYNTPPDLEALSAQLGPGSYEFIIVGWAVAADEYHLVAKFS